MLNYDLHLNGIKSHLSTLFGANQNNSGAVLAAAVALVGSLCEVVKVRSEIKVPMC